MLNRQPIKPCRYCKRRGHYPYQCYEKPKRLLNPESPKAGKKRVATATKWFKRNPPDEDGYWICYLQISTLCPKRLTRELITLEHVYPKVKRPDLKFEINNIKPACSFCNKMKGSRTPKQLAKTFLHIAIMLQSEEWKTWEAKLA